MDRRTLVFIGKLLYLKYVSIIRLYFEFKIKKTVHIFSLPKCSKIAGTWPYWDAIQWGSSNLYLTFSKLSIKIYFFFQKSLSITRKTAGILGLILNQLILNLNGNKRAVCSTLILNAISSSLIKIVDWIFSLHIPLIYEHLFYNYFVRRFISQATKGRNVKKITISDEVI